MIGVLLILIQLCLLLALGNMEKQKRQVQSDEETAECFFGLSIDKPPETSKVIAPFSLDTAIEAASDSDIHSLQEHDSTITATPRIDLEELQKVNSDTVGWIWMPDTEINYPVVQTSNNSFYLNHGFDGERSAEGAIFLDSRCDPDGAVRIIYGHNTSSGKFDSLNRYLQEGERYLQDHPCVYYFSADHPDGVIYDIFSVIIVDTRDSEEVNRIYQCQPSTEYVETIKQMSTFNTDMQVTETDELIILSTCCYSDIHRCVVCARHCIDWE